MCKGLCAESGGRQAQTVDIIYVQPMDLVCCKQALQHLNNNTESHTPTCAGSKYIMDAVTRQALDSRTAWKLWLFLGTEVYCTCHPVMLCCM